MAPYAVWVWHYLADGWEEKNRKLIRIAGRRPDSNVFGGGVRELHWYFRSVPDAEDLRDTLRVVVGVNVGTEWWAGIRKS